MFTRSDIASLYHQPLKRLMAQALLVHAEHFPREEMQLSSLLSIKTGGCPENCAYCPQSAHYPTGLQKQSLMSLSDVVAAARTAQENGATRFCMGAAWREVRDGEEFERVLDMIRAVRSLNMEVCCTLGMLTDGQARKLKEAGLYAYNHNIDTSRNFYEKVISTRSYDDRLETLKRVRQAGITVCTGGILGMGESDDDRIDFLSELYQMTPHPESITINALIPISGTPLQSRPQVSALDMARVIAAARCLMPKSMIRLSAGRKYMTEEGQFLCVLAGANSIFLGDTLLTSENPTVAEDQNLLRKAGLSPQKHNSCSHHDG